ncbi:MAG: polysaccharide biosynthesis protein [Caldilineaceae bacterium]|nr:polysaccharide biosynthesis protein [Caldilineaceae bacterium]
MSPELAKFVMTLRNRHFMAIDVAILALTPLLAVYLRMDDLAAGSRLAHALLIYTAYALVVRLVLFYRAGYYQRFWRYASVDELALLTYGALVTTLAITTIFYGLRVPELGVCARVPAACALPRSLPLIDGLLVFMGTGAVRYAARLAEIYRRGRQAPPGDLKRVLILGAGESGAALAKDMRANPQLGLKPVGFLDDDERKHGVRIHDVPVLGGCHQLLEKVVELDVAQVVIAMPSAPGTVIRRMVERCEASRVPVRIVPGLDALLHGRVSIGQLRPVQIEDLLRRDPVPTNLDAVQDLLRGKRVLVTGGGGSIGSELCRQVLRCWPSLLLVLGHGENSIFEIVQELEAQVRAMVEDGNGGPPPVIRPIIADIRMAERLAAIFAQQRPQVVFHAAAHKHVPLMEGNPAEAVTNNVLGTRNVVEAATAAGVERFVMISTDKAVRPTSIMGASKRVAELIVRRAALATKRSFVAVRFGNVLGSRGSVLLTFKKQIAAGGPVTVTHPEMTRFFMTIPEAVHLVLHAAVLGQGGEIFMLDMGEPVRIVDMARDLIELSGLRPGRDIEIAFTGMRPGEKLFEELFVPGESYGPTHHPKIFTAGNNGDAVPPAFDAELAALAAAAASNDGDAIVQVMHRLVPELQRPLPPAPTPARAEPPRQELLREARAATG